MLPERIREQAISKARSNGLLDEGELRATVDVEGMRRILGISRGAAYDGCRRGGLPCLRVGRRWVVPVCGLERMLAHPLSFRDGNDEGAAR